MTSQMAMGVKSQQETKQWSRINGWSFPLHLFQLLAWIFLAIFAMLYFGVLVPSLPSGPWQIFCATLNSTVFFFHIVVHIISVTLNPADPNVRAKNYRGPLPQFNRNQHSHVIENQYCYICEVKVGMKSKHCSTCNKCVSSFDHHCKWLNNCIGGRNYRLFIVCVSSALIGCLIILVTSISLVTAFFTKNSWLYNSIQSQTDQTTATLLPPLSTESSSLETLLMNASNLYPTTEYSNSSLPAGTSFYVFIPVTGIFWLAVVIATCCLSLIAVCLLTHLLGFHIYLMCIGLTTYDYIVQKRDPPQTTVHTSDGCCANSNCGVFKQHLKKANQISPALSGNATDLEELEMRTSHKRASSNMAATPSLTISNEIPEPGLNTEHSIQSFNSANVYLGSPQRQRQFLEPLYAIRQQMNKKESLLKDNNEQEMDNPEGQESSLSISDNNSEVSFESSNPNVMTTNHGLAVSTRKRHLSASPASTLPPIMESENQASQWYRSVSAQSLNSLSDDDDEHFTKIGAEPGLGTKRINSSLSNLLFSVNNSQEMLSDESDDGNSHGTEETRIEIMDNPNMNESLEDNEPTVKNTEPDTTEIIENMQWAVPVSELKLNGILDIRLLENNKNSSNIQITNGLKNALLRSSSQSDLYSRNHFDRRLSSALDNPHEIIQIPKNNYFSGPLFKTSANIIRIRSNSKDSEPYGTNDEYAKRIDSLERLDMYDSVVFDTQRSSANVTPVV